ncbi:ABC1 kinase family protein [Thalassotalea euphylliae]|uniref:ABC1 kinase family protein n=1 Tax=Thalassotalea euphylliae TaxID=1655234 RepID=UPI003636CC10
MEHEKKIPTSRFSRLTTFGGFVAKVAGNAVIDGAKQWSKGESPTLKNLVLQPKNIENLADKLAQLRGAAMKVGQLLSMDAGDLLPPELSQLLDKLRSNAEPMPHKQLLSVLNTEWGNDWLDNFSHFELKPFASASIGQVHVAYKDNGEKLAVKVQYPGVAKAINSDVDNVATLLKLSGLLPPHIRIDDLLEEAKKQLLTEADYQQEAAFIESYRAKLSDDNFIVPTVEPSFSTPSILVMGYVDGVAIDTIGHCSQAIRDNVASLLIKLFFDELFTFKLMQTDPNFANYLYQESSDNIVLLDFGATREIPQSISEGYRALISAGVTGNESDMHAAAKQIGFFADDICPDYLSQILEIFTLACEPLRHEGAYDFANSGLAQRIKAKGLSINRRQDQWHTPPVDAIFIHRKLAGLYLLAAKLKARINAQQLFKPFNFYD